MSENFVQKSVFGSVSDSIETITEFMNDSKEMRIRIEERMQAHRSRLNDLSGYRKAVSVNPSDKFCFICGRAICDMEISVFLKCNHTCHRQCCEEKGITSCPECGLSAIDMMDIPFVDPDRDSLLIHHWSLHNVLDV